MEKTKKLVLTTNTDNLPVLPKSLKFSLDGHKPKGKNLYKRQLFRLRRLLS